jgi:hypothetical protein
MRMTERPWRGLEAQDADAAIDRAVREIMGRDPAVGFRQRVLARIAREPGDATGFAAWLTPARLAIAAAAAVVLALTLWSRPAERPAETPVVAERPADRPTPPQPQSQPQPERVVEEPPKTDRQLARRQPPAATAPGRAPAAGRAPARPEDRRVSAASVTLAEEAAERDAARSVTPIDPISIPPLRIEPLERGEILISPVAIGPLKIVPLPPPR